MLNFSTYRVSPEITSVGQRVEVKALRTGEGVSDHSLARNFETPEILFAVGRVREKALVFTLVP
jgi:hypothetical protein